MPDELKKVFDRATDYQYQVVVPVEYWEFTSGRWKQCKTRVIAEAPVSITVNGETWLTLMCTPLDLEALAVGFIFNEGVIHSIEDVASVRVCPDGDNVDLWLGFSVEKPKQWSRTSGCTGGATRLADSIVKPPVIVPDGMVLTPAQISRLLSTLFESQDLYKKSGGVHTSALCEGEHVRLVAEDIGRHNTLDKLAGRLLLERIEFPHRVLITTGRISSEMLQKSIRMGVSVVISRTSPSALSVKMAEQHEVTLVGYARRGQFKVYAHPERIMHDQ